MTKFNSNEPKLLSINRAKLRLPLLIFHAAVYARLRCYNLHHGIITCLLPALALTQIKLSDITYHECPGELSVELQWWNHNVGKLFCHRQSRK